MPDQTYYHSNDRCHQCSKTYHPYPNCQNKCHSCNHHPRCNSCSNPYSPSHGGYGGNCHSCCNTSGHSYPMQEKPTIINYFGEKNNVATLAELNSGSNNCGCNSNPCCCDSNDVSECANTEFTFGAEFTIPPIGSKQLVFINLASSTLSGGDKINIPQIGTLIIEKVFNKGDQVLIKNLSATEGLIVRQCTPFVKILTKEQILDGLSDICNECETCEELPVLDKVFGCDNDEVKLGKILSDTVGSEEKTLMIIGAETVIDENCCEKITGKIHPILPESVTSTHAPHTPVTSGLTSTELLGVKITNEVCGNKTIKRKQLVCIDEQIDGCIPTITEEVSNGGDGVCIPFEEGVSFYQSPNLGTSVISNNTGCNRRYSVTSYYDLLVNTNVSMPGLNLDYALEVNGALDIWHRSAKPLAGVYPLIDMANVDEGFLWWNSPSSSIATIRDHTHQEFNILAGGASKTVAGVFRVSSDIPVPTSFGIFEIRVLTVVTSQIIL